MRRDLESDERDRLWQHGLHEDALFNERLNSFITFQSVLLALAAILVSSGEPANSSLLCALAVAGLGVSIVSAYVLAKQVHITNVLIDRCREALPEFAETVALLHATWWRRFSSKALLAYLIPSIFAVAWLFFLFA